MKLSVLTENTASAFFGAEHGLSYFIESDINILFDTGHTDLFLKNAEKLNIDIDKIETVILSHGHWDHGNGLKYLKTKNLICHPDVFQKRFRKQENSNIGLDLSFEELNNKFTITSSKEPLAVSKNITFLGEIPRTNDFEAQTTTFMFADNKDDFIIDDSALAIIENNELIVVSGCAHSGICNIIDYAKKVTGIKKIKAIIGGFHLKHNNLQTKKTIEYLKKQNCSQIYPSHCTELPALAAFYNEFKFTQVKAGMVYNF